MTDVTVHTCSVGRLYKITLSEPYEVVLKEYAEFPNTLLQRTQELRTQELRKCFDMSYAYVSFLKPKATTKNGATTKG